MNEQNQNFNIRPMRREDCATVQAMMKAFYASPAVLTNGSDEIFTRDLAAAIGDSPFLEGYVFEKGGKIVGYGLAAPSFSTEYGGPCIWVEDAYVLPEFRSQGLGRAFFAHLEKCHPEAVTFKLEVEPENDRAARLYRLCGYEILPYQEMRKLRKH